MTVPLKLISTDFDGTIFAEFETPPIPAELARLLGELQARGARWVINTGRDMSSLMESLGRSHLHVQPDFLVLVEREIYERHGGQYVPVRPWNDRCAADHAALFARVADAVASLADWINARFAATVYADPHSPLCIIADNNGDMDAIHARLDEFAAGVPDLTVVRNDVYARFSHAAYNKGTALAEIARRLGLANGAIFAVGDHLNDLPMLHRRHAGRLATLANAVPPVIRQVREQGGYVSPLARGAGVADALRHFLGETWSARL
jgi:HAD superfamily hydrolase (TIGR01484 family)